MHSSLQANALMLIVPWGSSRHLMIKWAGTGRSSSAQCVPRWLVQRNALAVLRQLRATAVVRVKWLPGLPIRRAAEPFLKNKKESFDECMLSHCPLTYYNTFQSPVIHFIFKFHQRTFRYWVVIRFFSNLKSFKITPVFEFAGNRFLPINSTLATCPKTIPI